MVTALAHSSRKSGTRLVSLDVVYSTCTCKVGRWVEND